MRPRPRGAARRAAGLLLIALAALAAGACGSRSRPGEAANSAGPESAASVIDRVVLGDRPPLALVARTGDPRPALAFAARHARGGALSAALAGLIAARLEAAGLLGVEARAHGLGVELTRLADTPDDAARFIRAVRAALAAPVRAGEPALARARRELAVTRALSFAGPAEAAAAACSGELGQLETGADLDLAAAAGIAALEATRDAVYRTDAAAFGALGPAPLLDAAADALGDSETWPTDDAEDEPWPEHDVTGVDRGSVRRLSVALRVGDADAAVSAGNLLAAAESELVSRLEALSPPWRLERASAVARRVGGCLRLDAAPLAGDPGPSSAEVARVAALIEHAASVALDASLRGALDESVLRPTDPRRAAALAAWRALPNESEAVELRRVVAYVSAASDSVSTADVQRALGEARVRLASPSFERAVRVETGQGELWALLASACGTGAESARDAGSLALLVRALARRPLEHGVRLEPWVTPDGVGLLAHAPRAHPAESAAAHAARVARVLGRAFAERARTAELGAARAELLQELGAQPFIGWTATLDGLSPDHPAWLEPRGTWQSVSELSADAVERARRLLLGSSLRLAVLANVNEAQASVAAAELEPWLLPLRVEPRGCARARAEAPRRGEIALEAGSGPALEGAYVGVLLGDAGARSLRAAEGSAFLLNRSGGWLQRALAAAGPNASARAHVLGGTRRPALVVDVRAVGAELDAAVARVRTLLDGLARGSASAEDLAVAVRELARRDAEARFDPRRRIVELWRGATAPELDLASLRAAHTGFSLGAHWVVRVVRAP